jgi:hypothetical protein
MKFLLGATIVAASICSPVLFGTDAAHAGWKCVKKGTGGAVCDQWVETPTKPPKPSKAGADTTPTNINRPAPPVRATQARNAK